MNEHNTRRPHLLKIVLIAVAIIVAGLILILLYSLTPGMESTLPG